MENIAAYTLNNLSVDPTDTGIHTFNDKPPTENRIAGEFDKKLAQAELQFRDDQMSVSQVPSSQVKYKNLAEEITYALSGLKTLRLSMDPDLKRVVVRVVDKRTNHVVRQLPTKQMVDLIKQMRDLEGLLFKASA